MVVELLILMPAAYLVGSIPWGLILARLFSGVNVRQGGSKNIGAFNVYRLAGRRLGIWTLVGDLAKGAVPVLAARYFLGGGRWQDEAAVGAVALAAFLGHVYSVFLRFRGGKGVATAAGCILVLSPGSFLVSMLVYVLAVCIRGYSSLGSLSAAAVLPGAMWVAHHSVPLSLCALTMTVVIFIRHKGNINRLVRGEEDSFFSLK